MMKQLLMFGCVVLMAGNVALAQEQNASDLFLSLFETQNQPKVEQALRTIDDDWKDEYSIMTIETLTIIQNSDITQRLIRILTENTDLPTVSDLNDLYKWLWKKDQKLSPDYHRFKSELYKKVDDRFTDYFLDHQENPKIRLDEIRWGGVLQDGIPPLRNPTMISVDEATYLEDDNIIFGIEVNGDARAYPKRILAWHEMFVDEVGGEPLAGVYCTLCGTVILFNTEHEGLNHEIGTSGFLYRSNKLMYDKATQSLWNTIWGEPVVGPLVGKGIKLTYLSVVTTTWGEWKKRHPDTSVLSLDTGYSRDYSEGNAYRNYFSTDRLMFNTPFSDNRLRNKDEILALRFEENPDEKLAIAAKFLQKNTVYEGELAGVNFVVFTDPSGANRVYKRGSLSFSDFDGNETVTDENGLSWTLSESQLVSSNGEVLDRLPYHRSFWFGWHAAYPDTKLVK